MPAVRDPVADRAVLRAPHRPARRREPAEHADALGHALREAAGRDVVLGRAVADHRRHQAGAAAPAAVAAGVRALAPVQEQHRDLALDRLRAADRVHGRAHRPAVLEPVAPGERAEPAHDAVEREVRRRVAVLVEAEGVVVDQRRAARRAEGVAGRPGVAGEQLHVQVLRLDQGDHEPDRGADRRRVVRGRDRAALEVELDLLEQAGRAEVLVVAEERQQRVGDAGAQDPGRDVEGADARVGAPVAVDQAVALLAHGEADAVGLQIADDRPRDVARVAPLAVGQLPQPVADHARGRGDHPAHRALHLTRAVAPDQPEHPLAGELHAGDLRAQLERHEPRQPRAPHPRVDDVLADLPGVDELHRGEEGRLRVDVVRLLDEAARLDAAELALVDHVVDPGEQPALPEDRRVDRGVHLVVRPDPGVVLEEDVALADPDVHRAVLQRPLDDDVGAAAEEQVARAEADARPVLGLDRGVEVEPVDHDLAAGDAADGLLVIPVDVPELRPAGPRRSPGRCPCRARCGARATGR